MTHFLVWYVRTFKGLSSSPGQGSSAGNLPCCVLGDPVYWVLWTPSHWVSRCILSFASKTGAYLIQRWTEATKKAKNIYRNFIFIESETLKCQKPKKKCTHVQLIIHMCICVCVCRQKEIKTEEVLDIKFVLLPYSWGSNLIIPKGINNSHC